MFYIFFFFLFPLILFILLCNKRCGKRGKPYILTLNYRILKGAMIQLVVKVNVTKR